MVGLSGVVLVDQVEGVPSEEDRFIEGLRLAVGSEGLVSHGSNIEVNCWLEAFLLHPWATVASVGDLVLRDGIEFVHDFGTGEVCLARVCEDADRLLVGGRE